MSIRKLFATVGAIAAMSALATPAFSAAPPSPVDYTYSITGFLNNFEVISGQGTAVVTGSSITGIDFTLFSFTGGSTSYKEFITGSTTTAIEASPTGANVGPWAVLSYAGTLQGSAPFTGTGGASAYNVFLGPALGSLTNEGPSLVADVKVSAVPLPGAIMLFGSAVAALGGFSRLRNRARKAA